MPTNPFHAIAPFTQQRVYMLMATHILIHRVFRPHEENFLPKPNTEQAGTLQFNNRNLHRRDRSEQERWARDYTITHISHHATICFRRCAVCMCVCVHARKAGKLSRESFAIARGRRIPRIEERLLGKLVPWGSIALDGAITDNSYHSASEDVYPVDLCWTTIVLSFCAHSRRVESRFGNGWRERENVKERKTPKHKQQN